MGITQFLTQPYGKLALLDVLIIAIYMLLCLYIGFRKSGRMRNIRDFALGRDGISTAMLVATIYATHLGAGATFGNIEKIREIGLLFVVAMLIQPIGWIITIWIFGRNIERFKGCLSLSDIMYKLYGTLGRNITNIVAMIIAIGTIAAQAHAMGYLIHYYLGMSITQSIAISIGVIVLYSVFGGITAVAKTDALQFLIFYIAIPYMCAVGFYKVGGISGIQKAITADKLSIDITGSSIAMFIGLIIHCELFGASGAFVQRFLMARDSKQLIQALKVVGALSFIMAFILCVLGIVTAALIPSTSSSKTSFLEMVSIILPEGAKGMLVAGLLAVIMSTADSWLNTASILFTHDFIRPIWPKMNDRIELGLARFVTVFIGALSAVLALTGSGIIEILWLAANFYAPVVLIPLSAGFLGFSTNSRSFLVAVICGVSLALLGAYIQGMFDLISLMFGLIGSATGLFGMHYFQIYTSMLERPKIPRPKKSSFSLSKYFIDIVTRFKRLHFKAFLTRINRTITQDSPNYYVFAAWGIVYCLYPLLLLVAEGDQNFINTLSLETMLRIIGVIGCVILLFHEIWLDQFREKYLGLYWYTILLWCLPMLGIYGLMLRYNDWIWSIHILMALFMLSVFANHRAAMIIMVVGLILGIALYALHFNTNWNQTSYIAMNRMNNATIALLYLTMALGIAREMIWKTRSNIAHLQLMPYFLI